MFYSSVEEMIEYMIDRLASQECLLGVQLCFRRFFPKFEALL